MAARTLLISLFLISALEVVVAEELSVCYNSGVVHCGKLSMGMVANNIAWCINGNVCAWHWKLLE